MVIESHADSIKVWVNGDLVNEGFEVTPPHKGNIAFQAEGAEMDFRKLELTDL